VDTGFRHGVIVIDFGAQYSQLIARRVREAHVYCEIVPWDVTLDEIWAKQPAGIVLSGGPASVYSEGAPACDPGVFKMGVPVLGICYGMQYMVYALGGRVSRGDRREYGKAFITAEASVLFDGVDTTKQVWMSHGDRVDVLPPGFVAIASTESCPVAACRDESGMLFGLQFHPEVVHTEEGRKILENFLYRICGLEPNWTMKSFVDHVVPEIRAKVGNDRVISALSGGVDSSVATTLVHRAVGPQLKSIFVDHGLLRKGEAEQVVKTFRDLGVELTYVDASERFLNRLSGVRDPETKRKIIGEEFIRVFEEEAAKLGQVKYLVQGTLYPDVIESGTRTAAVIKSHHNVGGLPEKMDLELIEPLRDLFKDEVRALGEELGLPKEIVWRQPFPGPGLAVRIIGEVTREKLTVLREADYIVRDEINKAGLDREIWQYFAVLTAGRSVGVMGDERSYGHTVAIRAVTSEDGMTADWAKIPLDVLERMSTRITGTVRDVNRVVYDITSKPPATIEWE